MRPGYCATERDYQDYLRCKKRIRVGDEVQLYLYGGSFYYTARQRTISEPIRVIGFRTHQFYNAPIIGANTRIYQSMYLTRRDMFDCLNPMLDIRVYEYMFILMDGDSHIANIIRANRNA